VTEADLASDRIIGKASRGWFPRCRHYPRSAFIRKSHLIVAVSF